MARPIWVEFGGERRTLTALANELGMKFPTLYYRIVVSGWPVEKACTTPVKTAVMEISFRGERRSLTEWGARLGIRANTLYRRIALSHWPVDKACSTPVKGHAAEKRKV